MSDLHSSWKIQLVETKKTTNFFSICFLPSQLTELTQTRPAKMTKSITKEEVGSLLFRTGMLCKTIPCSRQKEKNPQHLFCKTLKECSHSLCYGLLAIQGQIKKCESITFLSFLQLRAPEPFTPPSSISTLIPSHGSTRSNYLLRKG